MPKTTTSFTQTPYEQRRAAEFDQLCDSLCERLLSDSIPPDDAYWWARIAIQEAAGPKSTGMTIPVTIS
jgi:hypothetical protein